MNRYEVAIVGIGCRLPGGISHPSHLVQFLRSHGDAVCEVPPDRWNVDLYYHPDPAIPGKAYVKNAGFLHQDLFAFDPEPFGISPREADRLDPQQRLLLEATWDALEDAGVPVDRIRGSDTAVFVGGFTQDQQTLAFSPYNRSLIDSHTSVGASMTVLSNRISYTFDLHGPSLTIDTACSSSLVATHLGFEAVASGRSSMAIVGGVNAMLSPMTTIAMCKGHFLAPDGRSKTFDASADGYGRGEGVGIVVLKRVEDALRDGDRIYARVHATGVNQDGKTDGMPLPNEDAQRELCRAVLQQSGLQADDIAYVEAHGTGTRAGDPLETRALGAVYGGERSRPLLIGSLKTNIGHLEAAAGVAGLIKAALSVYHREIFPIRELRSLNPDIPFEQLNVEVACSSSSWPSEGPAHAAVNSFGYGGTNAHVILSECRADDARRSDRGQSSRSDRASARLVPISAASRDALTARAKDLASSIDERKWLDQAYTLACRRGALTERGVVIAGSAGELAGELEKLARGETSPNHAVGRTSAERKLLWVFTGMGPQWWAMGQQLYRAEPVYRDTVDEVDEAFRGLAGWSILGEMLRDESASRMSSNSIAQPANFVLQAGLVRLLQSWGVEAHGLLGHSVGEVAAAWTAGCLSLRDAVFLAYHRSRIQQLAAGKGTMLAVGLPEAEVSALLRPEFDIAIAAYNSPRSCALAGARQDLERVAEQLKSRGAFHRFMPVEVAYHSPHMAPLEREFFEALAPIAPNAPAMPLYSTLRGHRVQDAVHDAHYWWENARNPVLLQKALEAAIDDGYSAFLEIGPHPVLGASIREVLADRRTEGRSFYCLKRGEPEASTALRAVAQLHVSGVRPDWSRLYPEGKAVDLPQYPFQRNRHWLESKSSADARLGRKDSAPLLSERDPGPTPRLAFDLARPSLQYLLDHRIQGVPVFPGAGYIELGFNAAVELEPGESEYLLEDLRFEKAFAVRPDRSPTLLVDVDADDRIAFHGRHGEEGWQRHARARRVPARGPRSTRRLDIAALEAKLSEEIDLPLLYQRFDAIGLQYGPSFRPLARLLVSPAGTARRSMLARIAIDALADVPHCLHPALLDSAFQALLALTPDSSPALVPISIEQVRWVFGSEHPVWAHGHASVQSDGSLLADLVLANEYGEIAAEVRGLVCRPLEQRGTRSEETPTRWIHVESWKSLPAPPARTHSHETWTMVGDAISFLTNLAEQASRAGIEPRLGLNAGRKTFAGSSKVIFAVDPRTPADGGIDGCEQLLRVVRQLLESPAPLRVITFGAQPMSGGDWVRPDQAALLGFCRVIMTEHPELDCRLVDIDAESFDPMLLARVLADPESEEEIVIRGDQLHARRLTREESSSKRSAGSPENDADAALSLTSGDLVRSLFAARAPRAPQANEVELQILALPVRSNELAELARPSATTFSTDRASHWRSVLGMVTRVGPEAAGIRVGDRAYARYDGILSSHIVAPNHHVLALASGHGPLEGASYFDFMTAWYALRHLARIEPGEAVLVEKAATAAGRACVQIARVLGAEVFGIVDTANQEQELRSQGIDHLFRSSDPALKDEIRRHAPAGGLQVVVGAPDHTRRYPMIALLGTGGRFIDLAPDPAEDARIDLEHFRKGITFVTVNLDRFMSAQPWRYAALASEVRDAFERGDFRPGAVQTIAAEASFSMLASPANDAEPIDLLLQAPAAVELAAEPALFREDRTYLVTGGLSGLGLVTAQWMVEHGARSIVLGSRRGEPPMEALSSIENMVSLGARVECRTLDVASPQSLGQLLAFIQREMPPLAGVFHSAMVLDDLPLESLTEESLNRVMRPKARGAWILHSETIGLPLDYFVVFSSVSALVGNPRQASYAAANTYLDGLIAMRRARGLAGTSVSFGAIGDAGVVARDAATAIHLKGLGIAPIPALDALNKLEEALRAGKTHVGILDMNWDKWVSAFPKTRWNRLAELVQERGESDASSRLRAELANLDEDAKKLALRERIRPGVAQVFHLEIGRLDNDAPLKNYGLDSLLAVEVQLALESAVGITVPTMELLAGASVDDLVDRVLRDLEVDEAPAVPKEPEIDLRAHFLSRICVQPPYFDLFDFELSGEWVAASAAPLAPGEYEAGIVSSAEAARHLAIVGSCAVSRQCPAPGRVYFPVFRAEYVDSARGLSAGAFASGRAPLEQIRVRARCVDFDMKSSKATAETELLAPDGTLVLKLAVTYHVIPEAQFERLFERHAEPTNERAGGNPYTSWQRLPPIEELPNGGTRVTLGPIDPRSCLGHFVGYPALPVSIMSRHAIELIARSTGRKRGREGDRITVIGGTAETESFAFAHETVTIDCAPVGDRGTEETWRCEIHSSQRRVASFDYRVLVHKARLSTIQLREGGAAPAPRAGRKSRRG